MSVCWRCPRCREISCEEDSNAQGKPLACDHCERPFLPHETQCPVCDADNPWTRRDTIHFWCRECGHTQAFHTSTAAAQLRGSAVAQ